MCCAAAVFGDRTLLTAGARMYMIPFITSRTSIWLGCRRVAGGIWGSTSAIFISQIAGVAKLAAVVTLAVLCRPTS